MAKLRCGMPTFMKALLEGLGLDPGIVKEVKIFSYPVNPTVIEVTLYSTADLDEVMTEATKMVRYHIREVTE